MKATHTRMSINPEDIDVERLDWTPTDEQFQAYRAREIQLAMEARANGIHFSDTFFSVETWLCAAILSDAIAEKCRAL